MKSRTPTNARRIDAPRDLPGFLAILALLVMGSADRIYATEKSGDEDRKAAAADVGSDWTIVQEYLDWNEAQSKRRRALARGNAEEKDDGSAEQEQPRKPDIQQAAAAARSIIERGGAHERTIEAAEFLVKLGRYEPMAGRLPKHDEQSYIGAKALLEHAPGYEDWPGLLSWLDVFRRYTVNGKSSRPKMDELLEEMASQSENPTLRAAARYYVAIGLMRSANGIRVSADDREAKRDRALKAATGLGVGLEEHAFPGSAPGSPTPPTFAEAEAALLHRIRHATAGATVPELTGSRLDGAEERLTDYRGRVVLLDFWATWCVPCVVALPKLREMVEESPEDRFVLLSISVDRKVETVTEFQKDKPMPWVNWFTGFPSKSEIVRALDVRAFPTYILVDEEGEILARTNFLNLEFMNMLKDAVSGGTEG